MAAVGTGSAGTHGGTTILAAERSGFSSDAWETSFYEGDMKNTCLITSMNAKLRIMTFDVTHLSNDVDDLQSLVLSQKEENEMQRVEIIRLSEQVALLKRDLYGRKSEKRNPDAAQQESLFNEAETYVEEKSQPAETPKKKAGGTGLKKPGRRSFPAELPRREVEHDLPEKEQVCTCGEPLTRFIPKTSERLDVIPPKIIVEKHIRHQYKCRKCEGTSDESAAVIKVAPGRKFLLPKSIATAGFLAWIFTAKFLDHLPFYRQEKMFRRAGFEVPRATLCNLAINTARECEKLRESMWNELLKGPVLHIDETTLQVLKELGRSPGTKSYMWTFRGGPRGSPIIYFEYRETRSGEFLKERLKNYTGVIMTDGYSGYNGLGELPGVVLVNCWSHARRKFDEAKVVSGGSAAADVVLDLIGKLYAVEDEADKHEFTPEERKALRLKKSAPIIRELRNWLQTNRASIPPKSRLGMAVAYMIKRWRKLVRFLYDGNIPLDNNRMENDIRPFCLGRKNWMFSVSPRGAAASAFLYSIILSAQANGHEPYWYLRFLFELLPEAECDTQVRELLPAEVQPEEISEYFDSKPLH